MFKNMKIGLRFRVVIGLLFLFFLLIALFFVNRMEYVSKFDNKIYTHPFTVSNATLRIEGNAIRIRNAIKDVARSKDFDEINKLSRDIDGYEQKVFMDFAIVEERFLGKKDMYENALKIFSDWKPFRTEITSLALAGKNDEAIAITKGKGWGHVSILYKSIADINRFASKKAVYLIEKSDADRKSTLNLVYLILIVVVIVGMVAIDILIRSVVSPINKIMNATIEIGKGKWHTIVQVDSRDEIGKLADSFREMTKSLHSKTIESKRQNWVISGMEGLSEKIRTTQDVVGLTQHIINYMTSYLNAQIGAIYVTKDENSLRLTGSYAYIRRKNISNDIKFGEGLVGQSALEKKTILMTNIPDDYVGITSGLGEALPKNIIVVPFLYKGEVIGVLEFGSFDTFTDVQVEFITLIAEPIAIAVNNAKSNIRTQELLEQTQSQKEELQAREEELKASNEELENQTMVLKESESRLQSQHEELQVSNEELEVQKKEIEIKNNELIESQKRVEEKARDLELASKYKSEFLANMSHELRTPLNSMLILSNQLALNKEGNLTGKQEEYARTVYSSGKDLLGLINDILDLAKVEAGKMDIHFSNLYLKDFCEGIKQGFNGLAEESGLDFKVEIAKESPKYIVTDEKRLGQIVKNLISNSIKFTNEGSVNVLIGLPHPDIDLSKVGLDTEDVIAISVTDTGIGIPKDKQVTIFEAFQQADGSTSRKYGGTGLGLSISMELATFIGGRMQIESVEGEGSTFTLFLPVKIENELKIELESINKKQVLRSHEKNDCKWHVVENGKYSNGIQYENNVDIDSIYDDRKNIKHGDRLLLVIEDDPVFAKTLYDLAQENGFKCLIAGDGAEGLCFVDYYQPNAIILDITLPGIDGLGVMSRLKDNLDTRNIPVHFISGSENDIEAMRMGAIGFLSKPVNLDMIDAAFEKIEDALSRKMKEVVIVEDRQPHIDKIIELVGGSDVKFVVAINSREACELLKSKRIDCMIITTALYEKFGPELLKHIKYDGGGINIPVIVYKDDADIELSMDVEMELERFANDIVIKKASSPEVLQYEVTLFLHTVEKNSPTDKQNMLKILHNKEAILKGKKVLIVDDDVRNVFALSSVLEEYSMDIFEARNGKEGIKCLEKNPDIDLVLMDIMMPEMDGYETIREIRKQHNFKGLHIIALTAKAMKGDRIKCIEAGANDYISKPVEKKRLLSLLRVWLYK